MTDGTRTPRGTHIQNGYPGREAEEASSKILSFAKFTTLLFCFLTMMQSKV